MATLDDEHIDILVEIVPYDWPSTKVEVQKELQLYWSFRDEITIMDGTAMKGRIIIAPAALQDKGLKQLHLKLCRFLIVL